MEGGELMNTEQALAFNAVLVGELRGQIDQLQARVAELEGQVADDPPSEDNGHTKTDDKTFARRS